MNQVNVSERTSDELSAIADLPAHLPDHTELPKSKVEFVKNYL